MDSKDTLLLTMRPTISTGATDSPAEQFQNEVLRPILKFQHERIVQLFQHHLQKRKVKLAAMSLPDQHKYLDSAFQKDAALRNRLLGVVLGIMTTEEWRTFLTRERELSRRLNDLLVERIKSTLE